MKKKIFIVASILIFVIICGIIWYMTPSHFLNNVSAEDVKFIHVFNGNNGSNYTIGDKEQISYIMDNIQNISFKKAGISLGRKGYQYRLTFENADGKVIDEFIINSSNTLRNDPFFYRDENNSICAAYISNVLLKDFHAMDLNEEQSFLATVLEETTEYMIVEPSEDEQEREVADRIKIEYETDHIDYLYGIGRRVVIYYKGGINTNDGTMSSIKSNDISVEGFREWELNVTPSNEATRKKIISKRQPYDSTLDWHRQYNLYYYGLDGVGIEVDGKNMSLEKAINQGMITMSAILAKANQDVSDGIIEDLRYKDGGSAVFKYPDYTIVKYHTLDGNDDMYIGTPDIDIHVSEK